MGVTQLIRHYTCFIEVTNSSPAISRPPKVYMVVNFRARGVSRDARKLTWISMLIKKNLVFEKLLKKIFGFYKHPLRIFKRLHIHNFHSHTLNFQRYLEPFSQFFFKIYFTILFFWCWRSIKRIAIFSTTFWDGFSNALCLYKIV